VNNLNHFQTRPKVAPINTTAYLKELGLTKEQPSINYLRRLHRLHLMRYPFENLDVHFRRKIMIDIRKIYGKIVPTKRGGFCYELNLLFYHLLVHLGYECHLLSARVYNAETKTYGPEYDHMAILVKVQDDLYLCDVGFGDGIVFPKLLATDRLQMDANRYFSFSVDPDDNYFLRRTHDTVNFEPVFQFQLKPREPIEFIDMCDYHQSNPQSTFVGKKIITMLTEDGRITLTDNKLKIAELGEVLEIPVLNDDDFYVKMEEQFGIAYQSLLQD